MLLNSIHLRVFRRADGFGLVQAMVGAAVGVIVAAGMTQMLVNQQFMQERLSKNIAATNFGVYVMGALKDAGGCSASAQRYLTNGTPWTFTDNGPPIADVTIPADHFITESSASGERMLQRNLPITGTARDVLIQDVSFRNIASLGIANKYRANLEISFQQNVGSRAWVAPVTIPMLLTTTAPTPPTQRIDSCSPSVSGGEGTKSIPKTRDWQVVGTTTFKIPDTAKQFTLTMTGGGGSGGRGIWDGGASYGCFGGGLGRAHGAGGGGSGAAIISRPIQIRAGETVSITIGGGGSASCGNGVKGGDTVLTTEAGTYITGGGGGGAASYGTAGGPGGTCNVPTVTRCVNGDNGGNGRWDCPAGSGGTSLLFGILGQHKGRGGNGGCASVSGAGTGGYLQLDWWEEQY